MHGRTANVRPSLHPVDAAGSGELRRRVAIAVARRFGGSVRTAAGAAMPAVASRIASVAAPLEMPVNEGEPQTPALDARVRETGEW